MDVTKPPLSTIVEVLRTNGLRIAVIVVVALIAIRVSTVLVHGIFKALLDREATEGTAQELSAIEVQKRMDTLDELGANVIRFFVVVIAGIMILGALDLDVGPAVAGLGVVGIAVGFGAQSLVRDYLNGALILIENQYSKGDVVSIAGVSGSVEDFSLRRTTRPPSSSSVSIRFWTSIADSSWAVPSVDSRSSRALTMPWTRRVTRRNATIATMRIRRIFGPLSRKASTIVLRGGWSKRIVAMVATTPG
jgi:hypothetical protein